MLVGRRAETEALDRLLVGAREGKSGVLVLRGEAGIGKSALLEYVEGQAVDLAILRGIGIQSESDLPFAGLHQLLRPVLNRVERLPAPQAAALRSAFALSAEAVQDRFHVALGVLALLCEVADEQPLLCLVDDAQWLDGASTEALLFAARRLEAEPIAIVLAARDDPTRPFAAAGVDELRLAELGDEDARALAAHRVQPDAPPEVLDRLIATAHGNPLALIELSTAGAAGGELPTTSVEETYLERIRALPAAVRSMIVLAAAEESGDRATIARAAAELGLAEDSLSAAEAEGLVHVGAQRVDFHHPLVRSAAYRGAGFAERERAHRTLANVLTAEADADRRAWHLASATVGPDDDVAAELEQSAARARQRGGHGSAASALTRAAELSTADDERGRRLLLAAGSALLAGAPERTIALTERARPFVEDPIGMADLAYIRGTAELQDGRSAEASDTFAAAVPGVAPHDAGRALELTVASLESAGTCGDRARVQRVSVLGAEIEVDPADERQVMLSVLVEAGERVFSYDGDEDPAEAAALLRRALSLFGGSPDPRHNFWAGVMASFAGERDLARSFYGSAVDAARAAGALGALPYLLTTRAFADAVAGALPDAESAADEAMRLGRDLGYEQMTAQPLAVLAWIAAVRGEEERCRELVERANELAAPRQMALAPAIGTWALAELELGAGRWEQALLHFQELRDVRLGFGHPSYTMLSVPGLVEAASRAGRREAGQEPAAALAAWAEHTGSVFGATRVARCNALLAETPEEAIAHYEASLARDPETTNPFDLARTQLLYGELLRRLRRRSDAREHLRSALRNFERLGAARWADRAQNELRATGETARRRDPSTLGELTPQEQQIARLVAEGSSNKEVAAQLFLSPRTVEYHLRKVFQKLGIASRAELIRQGAGTELVGAS